MSYVMVPVPADHVPDVMQHIVRLMSQAEVEPWEPESISQLFADIDEPSRALLSTVAQSTLNGDRMNEGDVAATIELNWRETMGLVREINDLAREESHPPLVVRRTVTETLPNGRTRDLRILSMPEDVARLVYAADREHLLGGEHPLGPEHDGLG